MRGTMVVALLTGCVEATDDATSDTTTTDTTTTDTTTTDTTTTDTPSVPLPATLEGTASDETTFAYGPHLVTFSALGFERDPSLDAGGFGYYRLLWASVDAHADGSDASCSYEASEL